MLRNASRRKRHLAGDVWPVCESCVKTLRNPHYNGRPEKQDEGWGRRSQLQSLRTAAPLLHPAPASLPPLPSVSSKSPSSKWLHFSPPAGQDQFVAPGSGQESSHWSFSVIPLWRSFTFLSLLTCLYLCKLSAWNHLNWNEITLYAQVQTEADWPAVRLTLPPDKAHSRGFNPI